ncbi:hypothetical protein NJB25_07210 [Escherichia fergusonii]|mgnify:CR=1 FL=1|uniref:hypothetical protein n=1 Tax=Escherichia fergusonii TaxID=564 RepID=UPI001CC0CA9D|nr:hypothetical protein [Escherichia fergusonii]MBZ4076624.1 hypothetical protein [Escherichia fergusonii]MBZ4107312.1 hypothetical protein [Escherichia fergusonii]MBZ4113573.1 hypothetical protein [Escherichia fergusonii]MBZ4123145.1 hypothetical protein [Escherichia fergusonii]MBZ4126969.1 hypothetical protein [Escherichia fergusonii]
MAGQLDEVSKQILGTLLADFTDRQFSIEELKSGYEGPKIEALAAAVCDGDNITKVDFDIAFADLEKNKMVKTGPLEMYDNKPGSSVVVIGFYSKREYTHLTEAGYKAARLKPNKPTRVNRVVNNFTITGGQFSNVQLAAGEQVSQNMTSTTGTDQNIVSRLISILEQQGVVITDTHRDEVVNAVREANNGNAGSAKTILQRICGSAWQEVQSTIWPIVGDLVRKSIGL